MSGVPSFVTHGVPEHNSTAPLERTLEWEQLRKKIPSQLQIPF